MTVHKVAGHKVGENSEDLCRWLEGLEGCPPITVTALAYCENPTHGDEPPTWFYVEADALEGLARRRCIACGGVKHVLDSEVRWNHPPMAECSSCSQTMFELAAGFHVVNGAVDWLALATRCVGCGTLGGLTDMSAEGMPLPVAKASI